MFKKSKKKIERGAEIAPMAGRRGFRFISSARRLPAPPGSPRQTLGDPSLAALRPRRAREPPDRTRSPKMKLLEQRLQVLILFLIEFE